MKITKRIILTATLIAACAISGLAQNRNDKWLPDLQKMDAKYDSILQKLLDRVPEEAYDPLTPQAFVFDKAHNVFGAINTVENTIDIIKLEDDTLKTVKKILVDKYEGRHDVRKIYRPKGIAIYNGYLVFLASQQDSCYLSVLDLQGNEVRRFYYKGNATAFSYNKEAQQMYIAGQNTFGYDLVILSTKDGIENMSEDAPALHYQKPKKDEVIRKRDPIGIVVTAIAMGMVFLALLMLVIIFSNTGKMLKTSQVMLKQEKHQKNLTSEQAHQATDVEENVAFEPSGEEYAAIAAAIYFYNNELHDTENTILTIEKATRAWTPWNAKYYSMNQYFTQKSR